MASRKSINAPPIQTLPLFLLPLSSSPTPIPVQTNLHRPQFEAQLLHRSQFKPHLLHRLSIQTPPQPDPTPNLPAFPMPTASTAPPLFSPPSEAQVTPNPAQA
ncbi:hypothetical protein PRUPE_1G089900 [Prunus persica]|uniref:Uncharacterized protein n=1 Tax=Prunus persica TaxID=3760 RepID=A0A251QUP8_PRUPE|nr:hypothetical protein PRUPE_1G089900 [Prunus persica]